MKNLTAAVMELMPSYPSMWERFIQSFAYILILLAINHIMSSDVKLASMAKHALTHLHPLRYYLRKHALRTTAYVAASCALVHLAKRGLKKATKHVKYLGPAVAFLADVALPTPVVGPLLMARCML